MFSATNKFPDTIKGSDISIGQPFTVEYDGIGNVRDFNHSIASSTTASMSVMRKVQENNLPLNNRYVTNARRHNMYTYCETGTISRTEQTYDDGFEEIGEMKVWEPTGIKSVKMTPKWPAVKQEEPQDIVKGAFLYSDGEECKILPSTEIVIETIKKDDDKKPHFQKTISDFNETIIYFTPGFQLTNMSTASTYACPSYSSIMTCVRVAPLNVNVETLKEQKEVENSLAMMMGDFYE
ncbi:hypothetical protein P9112_014667 [Eukaryota sp. TZLM1-RC]